MKRLYTFYEGSAEEVLKGSIRVGERIEVRILGGEKDGTRVSIPGVATLTQNEDSVLMLSQPNADGSHDVFGLMMGKYVIKKDAEGEEYLIGAGIPPQTDDPQADPTQRWTLARVRDLIREQGANPKPTPSDAIDPSAPIQHPGGSPTSTEIVSESDEGGPDSPQKARTSEGGLPASTKILLGIIIGGAAWIFWRRRNSS